MVNHDSLEMSSLDSVVCVCGEVLQSSEGTGLSEGLGGGTQAIGPAPGTAEGARTGLFTQCHDPGCTVRRGWERGVVAGQLGFSTDLASISIGQVPRFL